MPEESDVEQEIHRAKLAKICYAYVDAPWLSLA